MKSIFFRLFVFMIIFVKILFMIFYTIQLYYKKINNQKMYVWSSYWRELLEFIFIILMSILCIVLFNPLNKDRCINDHHIRVLLLVYGFVVLVTSDWDKFLDKLPKWFTTLQAIV